MLNDAIAAFRQIFSPPFRAVLWKTMTLTLAVLALVWVCLDKLVVDAIAVPYPWLATALSILTGVGLLFGLAFLVAPISSLIVGFFLDDIAEIVERTITSSGQPGRSVPVGQAVRVSARFAALSVVVNLFALVLLFVPGVNALAFLGANAYLLGREYFELAALRFRPPEEARAMRREHQLLLFALGFLIAAFVTVPVLNLFTPLFGTAFMVRVHRRLAGPVKAVTVS